MPLRDLLKKRDKVSNDQPVSPEPVPRIELPKASEFTFVRTDTHTEEVIAPPTFHGDDTEPTYSSNTATPPTTPPKSRGLNRFRKSPSAARSVSPPTAAGQEKERDKSHGRLSQRLHITPKSRASSTSSANVPADLPAIADTGDRQETEAAWEERATRLAKEAPLPAAASLPPQTTTAGLADPRMSSQDGPGASREKLDTDSRPQSRARSVSDAAGDATIQEAIRLHETGSLPAATQMFHTLATSGNVLAQVLYGLSLRHGWGCTPDPALAITYLSAAASNSAAIEAEALKAGMKKGGAAKGELVLAIFELANCFRHGWGVAVDKVAARQYYETAANLGDTDAMNEAAWCYLEGFGGKKDKFKAAQLLRLAETSGAKTLGNTWIWKDKYNPLP